VNENFLDGIPVIGVYLLIVGFAVIAHEAGFRVGRWRQARLPDEKEGQTGLLVPALLGMFAFLLAVTMGMASDRFDARRSLVRHEANSIGTTFLRAGFLPEPERTAIRDLLREYVPLRITVADHAKLAENDRRSGEIQDQIWTRTEELAAAMPESEVLGLFIQTLNETIDLQNDRLVVGVYGRVPDTVVAFLLFGGAFALILLGYHAGLGRRRSFAGALVFILVLAAVVTLVIDLDRPRDGFITVSQRALIDLHAKLGDPSP
jgi:hypothetical protein